MGWKFECARGPKWHEFVPRICRECERISNMNNSKSTNYRSQDLTVTLFDGPKDKGLITGDFGRRSAVIYVSRPEKLHQKMSEKIKSKSVANCGRLHVTSNWSIDASRVWKGNSESCLTRANSWDGHVESLLTPIPATFDVICCDHSFCISKNWTKSKEKTSKDAAMFCIVPDYAIER